MRAWVSSWFIVWVLWLVVGATPAGAESGVTAGWQGLHTLGLSPEEGKLAEEVVASSLAGEWIGHVQREDEVATRCETGIACHCEAARKRGLRFVAFGLAGRLGSSWSVELTMIETHACTVVSYAQLADDVVPSQTSARLRALGKKLATPPETTAATAVKAERSLDHTPAIVSNVTAAELTATQMTTFEDVLASQSGFDVVDTNWGAMPIHQGLRNVMLLVVDGIPQINGLLHLRALGRDARVSTRNVDRIEFVRGPGSVLWGPNAFLGVINIVTKSARGRSGKVDAGLELGSANSQNLWVNGAQSRGDYAISVGLDVGSRRGLPTVVADSPWAVRGLPAGTTAPWGNAGVTEQQPDQWFDLGMKVEAGGWLSAMFKNQSSYTLHEIGLYGVKLAPGQEGYYDKTWRTYALSATQDVGALKVTAQASRFEFHSWENFAVQPMMPTAVDTDPEAIRHGQRSLQGNPTEPRVTHTAELRLNHFAGYPEGGWKNQLLAGVQALQLYTPINYATITGVDQTPAEPFLDFGAKRQRSVSFFGMNEWSPYTWFVLAAGARFRVEAPIDSDGVWKSGVNMQGAAVIAKDGFGAKVVYAEGYRVPDGNSLFSTSGVRGDPTLTAERSRDLAAELHVELSPLVTARVGGNVTRLFNLIRLQTIFDDPMFSTAPFNGGQTDLASGYAELRLSSEFIDATARYGVSGLRETEPLGTGIPYAPHNLFGALVVRPFRDVSVFARSSAVSPRDVTQMTRDGNVPRTLPWAVRLALGGTVSNILPGFDLDIRVENPFNFKRRMPYDLSGNPTFVEDRTGSEAFATLRWSR